MRRRKILTSVFAAPAAPMGTGFARFSVYRGLTSGDIDYIVGSTRRVLHEIYQERSAAA